MALYQYRGGLPTGTPTEQIEVRVIDDVLRFEHQHPHLRGPHAPRTPWAYNLWLEAIDTIEVNPTAQELTIHAQVENVPAAVVLHGRPAELEQLRHQVLQARARVLEEREA